MSYYYSYRLGYKKDGKLYPLAPFSESGKWKDIICRSRNYASDLHEYFAPVSKNMVTAELAQYILDDYYTKSEGEQVNALQYVKYLPLNMLPSGDYVKSGYFLIDDVKAYENSKDDCDDLFYDKLSPTEYAARLENYMKFGDDEKRDENGDLVRHSIKDYMYYAYPDYSCKEFEAFQIRFLANESFAYDKFEIVALDFEG